MAKPSRCLHRRCRIRRIPKLPRAKQHQRASKAQHRPRASNVGNQRQNQSDSRRPARGALTRVNLSANTDLQSVDEFENIIVRRNDSGTVRLNDIAKVELGSDNYGFETARSGETAIFVGVWVLLVGAIFVIQLFGFSINVLTLLAIVLSVGLVVDDAIIMVENIERHIEQGKSPKDAALIGARELVGPIISMTITIVSVYIPIAFQGGLTGALFREFAITLAGAIVVSAVIALTLSPMLGAKLLKPHKHMAGPLDLRFNSRGAAAVFRG